MFQTPEVTEFSLNVGMPDFRNWNARSGYVVASIGWIDAARLFTHPGGGGKEETGTGR
jgi:hypothetical protein